MYILERFIDHSREPAIGCVGELYKNGYFFAYTMEQPWKQNSRFISCIPSGLYEIEPINTPSHGDTGVLVNHDLNVFATQEEAQNGGRYACLIHPANWSHQLQGCIALGEKIAWGKHKDNDPNLMITNSRTTVNNLLPDMIGEELLIIWRHEK